MNVDVSGSSFPISLLVIPLYTTTINTSNTPPTAHIIFVVVVVVVVVVFVVVIVFVFVFVFVVVVVVVVVVAAAAVVVVVQGGLEHWC